MISHINSWIRSFVSDRINYCGVKAISFNHSAYKFIFQRWKYGTRLKSVVALWTLKKDCNNFRVESIAGEARTISCHGYLYECRKVLWQLILVLARWRLGCKCCSRSWMRSTDDHPSAPLCAKERFFLFCAIICMHGLSNIIDSFHSDDCSMQ